MWTNVEALPPTKYSFNFEDAMCQNVCTGLCYQWEFKTDDVRS